MAQVSLMLRQEILRVFKFMGVME